MISKEFLKDYAETQTQSVPADEDDAFKINIFDTPCPPRPDLEQFESATSNKEGFEETWACVDTR